jgi:hypothetical protein
MQKSAGAQYKLSATCKVFFVSYFHSHIFPVLTYASQHFDIKIHSTPVISRINQLAHLWSATLRLKIIFVKHKVKYYERSDIQT